MKMALTGSPHSGKTTTLLALRARGHNIISESAIDLIESLNGLCGLEGCREWRQTHNVAWQDLVVARQLYLERQAEAQSIQDVIIDSTPIDCLAFTCVRELDPVEAIMDHTESQIFKVCENLYYDLVFCLDTILPFDSRPETGRSETLEDCQEIRESQIHQYTWRGMSPIIVPQMSVEARVQMIEYHIKRKVLQMPDVCEQAHNQINNQVHKQLDSQNQIYSQVENQIKDQIIMILPGFRAPPSVGFL